MILQQALYNSFIHNEDRIALETDMFTISYKKLWDLMCKLASFLCYNKISGEVVAGVFNNECHYVYFALGVCITDNIFMPIDDRLPSNKICDIITHSGTRYVILDKGIPDELLFKIKNTGVLCINLEDILTNSTPITYSINTDMFSPTNPIYLYATSGTTGIPKYVIGRNESLAHFIKWEINQFEVSYEDVFLQTTSPSFDPYLRDIFTPLCAGARIFLPNRQISYSPKLLTSCIAKYNVTFWHTTPTILKNLLLGRIQACDFDNMRYILIAGEPVSAKIIHCWYAEYNMNTVLVNLYGPTETTLAKTYYMIPKDFDEQVVPVGIPLPGVNILTLPAENKIGEVYIQTQYMSLGYLNDNYNSSFSSDAITGLRTYKTGDLGYIKNGHLYLTGRIDNQIKKNGIRIYLEEIAQYIIRFPDINITDCCVVYGQDEVLVAFCLTQDEIPVSLLCKYLKNYLLPIHIPINYIQMSCLPTTMNGKIDRNELARICSVMLYNKKLT